MVKGSLHQSRCLWAKCNSYLHLCLVPKLFWNHCHRSTYDSLSFTWAKVHRERSEDVRKAVFYISLCMYVLFFFSFQTQIPTRLELTIWDVCASAPLQPTVTHNTLLCVVLQRRWRCTLCQCYYMFYPINYKQHIVRSLPMHSYGSFCTKNYGMLMVNYGMLCNWMAQM